MTADELTALRLTAEERKRLTEADGGACDPPCEMCQSLFAAVESILAARAEAAEAEVAALRGERDALADLFDAAHGDWHDLCNAVTSLADKLDRWAEWNALSPKEREHRWPDDPGPFGMSRPAASLRTRELLRALVAGTDEGNDE